MWIQYCCDYNSYIGGFIDVGAELRGRFRQCREVLASKALISVPDVDLVGEGRDGGGDPGPTVPAYQRGAGIATIPEKQLIYLLCINNVCT